MYKRQANGRPERLELRSYERQGLDKIPTVHMGPAVSQMEKRGIPVSYTHLDVYKRQVLFNAPSTIDSYYTALVNHDMYGGTIQSARKKGIPDYTFNEGESL